RARYFGRRDHQGELHAGRRDRARCAQSRQGSALMLSRIGGSLIALAGVAVSIDAHAAAPGPDHSGCAMSLGVEVPKELLERPVSLRKGVGNIHDPTSTKSKEAQALYDQGLGYVHSYSWIEASRSFHAALKLDPEFALAWVALSRAFV